MIKDSRAKLKTILYCLLLLLIYIPPIYFEKYAPQKDILPIKRLFPMFAALTIIINIDPKLNKKIIFFNPIKKKRFIECMVIIIAGYGFTYLAYNFTNLISTIIPSASKFSMPYSKILKLEGGSFLKAIFLNGAILAVTDELVFRGLILGNLKKAFSPFVSVIIGALIYALFQRNFISAMYLFVMGIFFSIAYLKTESIYITILGHLLINIFAICENYFKIFKTAKFLGIIGIILLIPSVKILLEWYQMHKLFAIRVNIDSEKPREFKED